MVISHTLIMILKFSLLTALLISASSPLFAAPDPPLVKGVLDFTKGGQMPEDASHDWNLGAIGARGWCQVSKHGAEGTTVNSRQMLITQVDVRGAAAKLLKKGDVIVGVFKEDFTSDARVSLAKAITAAEASKDGVLSLRVYDGEKTKDVAVTLKKFPAYANSAPFNCEKSEMILKEGCDALAKRGVGRPSIAAHINGLALLAAGEKSYMDEVKKLAQATVRKPYGPEISLACWHYSFANIFLAEYYLITGDRSVLPEIRRMSTLLVKGQGPMGTWGHTFAEYDKDRLRGYGAVNAAGLPVSISLVLARECGLKFKGLDEAIEESSTFFRRHVGIGAIPYGDGPPNLQFGHDDNGKNSAAAILFSLLGDEKSTRYYARTALACYGRDREQGHTGNFWNMLWAMPAVSLGGPQATGAWMEQFSWYYDLARDADYSFRYQGYPSQRGNGSTAKWKCAGAYLLHYAAPKKNLRILGKGVTCQPKFTVEEIMDTIESGNVNYRYVSKSFLEEGLSSWSPVVRKYSNVELRRRKAKMKSQARMTAKNPLDRISAINASERFKDCAKMLSDPDLRVRIAAMKKMASMDKPRAVGEVFERLAKVPNVDPVFTQEVGDTFFPLGVQGRKVGQLLNAQKDRKTMIKGVMRLLDDEDALVSSRVAMGVGFLPKKELYPLLPVLHDRTLNPPPGNVMFANKLRTSSAEVLVGLELEEGLELAVALVTDLSWGKGNRIPQAAKLTMKYGGHAKPYIKDIKKALATLNPKGDARWHALYKDMIKELEGMDDAKGKLKRMKDL